MVANNVIDKWHTARDYLMSEMEKISGINAVIESNKITDAEKKDMVAYIRLTPSVVPTTVQSGFKRVELNAELGIYIKNENKSMDAVKLDDAQCLLYQFLSDTPGNVDGKYKALKILGTVGQTSDKAFVNILLTL